MLVRMSLDRMSVVEQFQALPAEGRDEVAAVFRSELARGWIPKEPEVLAVIREVAERLRAKQPARVGGAVR